MKIFKKTLQSDEWNEKQKAEQLLKKSVNAMT